MASRRLIAERFLTDDFRLDVYTPEGMEWIQRSSLKYVNLRHMPEIEPALEGINKAFKAWNAVID